SKIFLDHVEVQRLIRYYRINAEAAGIRAPEASDHRDHFYEWRFSKGRFDKFPALSNSREFHWLTRRRNAHSDRPMSGAILQHIAHRLFVGEAQNIVEILERVLGVAPCVGASDGGDRPFRTKQIAERISELRRF